MKTTPNPTEWNRLVAAARRAPADTADLSAPFGFATRVAAQAMAGGRVDDGVFARLALRALGVSCLLMIASVAANISPIMNAVDEEAAALGEPATVEVETLDVS